MKHFIVIMSFKVPVVSIGEHLFRKHLDRLLKGYETGYILMYGPREPEDGIVVVARVESRQELGSVLAADPLVTAGLASYDFMEFMPIRFPTSLQGWVDPLGFRNPTNPKA